MGSSPWVTQAAAQGKLHGNLLGAAQASLTGNEHELGSSARASSLTGNEHELGSSTRASLLTGNEHELGLSARARKEAAGEQEMPPPATAAAHSSDSGAALELLSRPQQWNEEGGWEVAQAAEDESYCREDCGPVPPLMHPPALTQPSSPVSEPVSAPTMPARPLRAPGCTVALQHKRCRVCCVTKPAAEFYRDIRKLDGLHSWCKACQKARQKARRRAHKRPQESEQNRKLCHLAAGRRRRAKEGAQAAEQTHKVRWFRGRLVRFETRSPPMRPSAASTQPSSAPSEPVSATMPAQPQRQPDASQHKRCRICCVIKPAADFYRGIRNPDGLHSWCKACCMATDGRHRAYERPPKAEQTHKLCRSCGWDKPVRDFLIDRRTLVPLSMCCCACLMLGSVREVAQQQVVPAVPPLEPRPAKPARTDEALEAAVAEHSRRNQVLDHVLQPLMPLDEAQEVGAVLKELPSAAALCVALQALRIAFGSQDLCLLELPPGASEKETTMQNLQMLCARARNFSKETTIETLPILCARARI